MKIFLILSLIFSIHAVNVFSQTAGTDSSFNSTTISKSDNIKPLKTFKKISAGKTSSKESGMLIGAAIGAGAGILIGLAAGSISLEPHSDNSVPFGMLVVGGVAGAFVRVIIGGLVSEK